MNASYWEISHAQWSEDEDMVSDRSLPLFQDSSLKSIGTVHSAIA
ncbi:hypothetical protein Desti_1333 [Desulfomonile tiedjei DSM 6799]|uniref:Uncharacterized protein n=1 Tax=Desulfomonile tiedjei (strain ATCC 49306 / DSM 6799 / DCB-1) TaxID=706587 RepID=I4C3A5_DESTA|nr:hypothetical protein Desti_1333 [Desulfomonile tiedjei DSM 6799]